MNEREAQETVRLIEASWRANLGSYGRDVWCKALIGMDAGLASRAVLKLSMTESRLPTIADFRAVIKRMEADERAKIPALPETAGRSKVPPWVRRWVAARYLYASFGRAQDMRPFREQDGYVNPLAEFMPEGEWADEAARISDEQVWRAVGT